MKCEKCGNEIADGKMYCESCGSEIQMVPDFEPEVEQTIDQTMSHILKDVFHHSDYMPKKTGEKERGGAGHSQLYKWIVLLLTFSIAVLLLVFGYMNYTADYQIRRGNYFLKIQDYVSAVKHYEKANALDEENAEIDLYLAECFAAMDKIAGYEASLTNVIQNPNASDAQYGLAYMRLASLYLEKNEYQKINSLLKNCSDEDILNIFGKYCAAEPLFSHRGGEYTEIVPLKLQGGEKGIVYYTLDGSDPTAASQEYAGPIFLEKGEYTIKAIYVNEFGVYSDIVIEKYNIKL